MTYFIDYETLAKLNILASKQNTTVDILIKNMFDNYLKDVKLEHECKLSKPISIKRIF